MKLQFVSKGTPITVPVEFVKRIYHNNDSQVVQLINNKEYDTWDINIAG